MANPGSWAVVLPDKSAQMQNQLLSTLYTRNMQQQRIQSLQQQRELVRNQNLTKFLGENFKDSNYATGTAADPVINQMTSDAREKFAKVIHDNPNMDEAELEMQMQQELGKISQYSSKIKAGKQAIDDQTGRLANEPGVDVAGLRNGAMTNFLYNVDPGGSKTLRSLDQLDPSKNYVNDTLSNSPELYVQGDQPIAKAIEGYKPKKGGDTAISENKGVTTENKYTDQVYPWQAPTKDAKGNVTGIQMNGQPATLADGTILKDPKTGQPLQIVNDETAGMFNTPGAQAMVRRDVNQYIKDNGGKPEDFPVGSEGYNMLSKHILYNKLNELTPSEFTHERKQTDASIVTKMQLGVVDALGRTITRSEEQKEQELLGSRNGKIRLAASFDPTVISAGKPYTDQNSGKQYIDVTDAVGGFHTLADEKGTTVDTKTGEKIPGPKQIDRVMIDPQNPGVIYTEEHPVSADGGVDENQSHIVEYKGKDIDALLTRHATANGYKSLKEVRDINDKIPIQPNMAAVRQLRAELEFQRRQNSNLNPQTPVPMQ